MSELQDHDKARERGGSVEDLRVLAQSLGRGALTGHDADGTEVPAVADEKNMDHDVGETATDDGLEEIDMTAPTGGSHGTVRASGGRILMGDLIGWDRVSQMASQRTRARRLAAEFKLKTESGQPVALLSGRPTNDRTAS